MKGLRTFMMAVNKTNIFVGKMMVIVTLMAVAIITFEVVMRYLFNMPTNWGHESMTLLFAIYYCVAAGYAHYYRAHVRVDVFYSSRSPRTRAYLDIVSSFFFLTFFLFIHAGTFIGLPKPIMQGQPFLGLKS